MAKSSRRSQRRYRERRGVAALSIGGEGANMRVNTRGHDYARARMTPGRPV